MQTVKYANNSAHLLTDSWKAFTVFDSFVPSKKCGLKVVV